MKRRISRMLLVLVLFSILAPQPAYGYIDPISGSIILQVLVAGFFGATITFKRFRARIRRFFQSSSDTDVEQLKD